MRFLMLLRKELRESLPWILLAAIALFAIGSLLLHDQARYERNSWNYPQLFPGARRSIRIVLRIVRY